MLLLYYKSNKNRAVHTHFYILSIYCTLSIHRLTSNEFIAVKKILAMKIHRSEKETFIALSILALFLLFFGFFSIFGQKSLDFCKKIFVFFIFFKRKFEKFKLLTIFFSSQIHRIHRNDFEISIASSQ